MKSPYRNSLPFSRINYRAIRLEVEVEAELGNTMLDDFDSIDISTGKFLEYDDNIEQSGIG